MAYTYNESLNIDLLNYSPKYSNRQSLLFKILNKNDDNTYNIIFEDNTIINNVYRLQILNGQIFNPNSKNKIQNRLKIFYHLAYQKAILCKTRIEFSNNYSGLYQNMQRNNWLEDICSHMIKLKNNWTKEECHQKALLCNTRIEFYNNYTKYYQKALKENWLDEICSHMILLKNIWTKEHCKIEALKYKTRSEFYYKSQNIYHIVYKNNWLDEICSHMILNNAYNYPREIYAYEFSDNHVYIGLTKNIEIRNKYRYKQKNDAVILHINKTNLTPKLIKLTELIPAKEAQIKEAEFINQYKENNWNILNKVKAGSLGG